MAPDRVATGWKREAARLLVIVLAGAALAGAIEFAERPAALSATEKRVSSFDLQRFSSYGDDSFDTFEVKRSEPLRKALADGKLSEGTLVLVTETKAGRLALVTDQMSFHHIAQGVAADKPWMVAFCAACNSGVSIDPVIDGELHHFDIAGIYDGMSVMQDDESDTLWNHITGEALYGSLAGRRLAVSNLLQMNARQALELDAGMQIAISPKSFVRTRGPKPDETLGARFAQTLGEEDARRPRMELGLGLWEGGTHRFYPMEALRERRALIDSLGARKVLVYLDRESGVPGALFVEASAVKMRGDEPVLDDESVVRSGLLLGRDGKPKPLERPRQLFTRWYAFSLSFPRCEIFGEPRL